MNVAFYAPLKAPDDPTPSGDRLIGRMLLGALDRGGHRVDIVARLRSFDGAGDADRQRRIAEVADRLRPRVARRTAALKPDVWLTYHLYHKAPDWLGPSVSRDLGIPYCVAEASLSARQVEGPWSRGHRAVREALEQAALVANLNPKDEAGIRPVLAAGAKSVLLQPFIAGEAFRAARGACLENRAGLATRFGLDAAQTWLLAVGMMRGGDKQKSYRVLRDALARIEQLSWQLIVVGDGTARAAIERDFASFGARVRFLGAQPGEMVARAMGAADLFVWPAMNEAIGMVFIEAAMAGLPVIGADRPGIAHVAENGSTGLLVPEGDAPAFADAIETLLADPSRRRAMGEMAAAKARSRNDVTNAGREFCRALEGVAR